MALKDEKEGTFTEQETNFIANTYNDDDMEDLEANAAVMLMANMQELQLNDSVPVYDTDGLSQVQDLNTCLIQENASPSASESDKAQVVPSESCLSSQEDEQINTFVIFDDDTVVSFDDLIEEDKHDHVEQHEPSSDPDPDYIVMAKQPQAQILITQKKNEHNKAFKKDIECYKTQLSHFQNEAKREKYFEKSFQESYVKEQNLQNKMHELIESNGKLVFKMENDKNELKKQVVQLQKELSKTQTELSTCKQEFYEHKMRKREK
jgi:vacuolar-type H+-ATPase subunit I/STV1